MRHWFVRSYSSWRHVNTKNLISNPYHNHTHRRMLEQLPLEIVDDIIEYLDFEDVRSIARVCSAFRVPAQGRLFRTIQFAPNVSKVFPNYIESILSSPYLLQYTSHLVIHCFNTIQEISLPSLWSHLPIMYRLRNMDIYLELNDCLRMLSAPECLGLAREITLSLSCNLAPDLLISDDPLPVHALELWVDASNHQLTTRLVQKCSQSLRKLQLSIAKNTIPPLPFLPHLDELSLFTKLHDRGSDPDLLSLFPFLDQHPTITRISLGSEFTLAVQPPPNLLPNLQFLSATPAIIERLLPGRPVNDIYAKYISRSTRRFPDDIMLQSLRQPFVPVTTLAIRTDSHFYNQDPANIVQALPNLREFTLEWPCFEVRQWSEGRTESKLTSRSSNACWLLLVDARTWFISKFTPRLMVIGAASSGLYGQKAISFRWYKGYKRTVQLVSGVLSSRPLCQVGKKVVRLCE